MVLLVDDDPKFLREAENALASAGHKVFVALNGDQAISLMRTVGGDVHLIMVDLDLPTVSGFEVIQRMRKLFPDIPVIAFSGVMQTEMLNVAKYLGAQDALRKPITGEWLSKVAKTKTVNRE